MAAPSKAILATFVTALQVGRIYGQSSNHFINSISPASITVSYATDIIFNVDSAPGGSAVFGFEAGSCSTASNLFSTCTTVAAGSQYSCSVTVGSTAVGLKVCYNDGSSGVTKQETNPGAVDLTLDVVAASESDFITTVNPTGVYLGVPAGLQTNTKTAPSGGYLGFEPWPSGTCDPTTTTLTAISTGPNPTTTITISSSTGTKKICWQAEGGSDLVEQTPTLQVSSVGGGSDPITWNGDMVRVYELPVGMLHPLLQTSDMALRGETFAHGGPWQQWFGRMVLSTPDRSHWLQISVKKDILHFNRSKAPKGHFETLDVSMGVGPVHDPPMLTPIHDVATKIPLNFLGFNVEFWKMNQNAQAAHTKIGAARRECMEVAGASMHFFVCSAPAHEFFGWQYNLSIENAHLDFVIVQMQNSQELRGILPELWGMQPLSDETRKFIVHDSLNDTTLTKNSSAKAMGVEVPKLPEGSLPKGQAWAGGFGHDDLLQSCKVGNESVLGCKDVIGDESSKVLSI